MEGDRDEKPVGDRQRKFLSYSEAGKKSGEEEVSSSGPYCLTLLGRGTSHIHINSRYSEKIILQLKDLFWD